MLHKYWRVPSKRLVLLPRETGNSHCINYRGSSYASITFIFSFTKYCDTPGRTFHSIKMHSIRRNYWLTVLQTHSVLYMAHLPASSVHCMTISQCMSYIDNRNYELLHSKFNNNHGIKINISHRIIQFFYILIIQTPPLCCSNHSNTVYIEYFAFWQLQKSCYGPQVFLSMHKKRK